MCVSSVACSYYVWMSRQPADRLIVNGGHGVSAGFAAVRSGGVITLSGAYPNALKQTNQ